VLTGRKTLLVWHPEQLGGVEAIVSKALRYGITALAFKHDDGGQPFHDAQSTFGLDPSIITKYRDYCHWFGIKFGLWGYHYGADWKAEAQMVARAAGLYPDFYVVDWEVEFEANIGGALDDYLNRVTCTYAGEVHQLYHAPLPQPSHHRPHQYQAFNAAFDGMMPQMYHRAMELPYDVALDECYQDYITYGLTNKPIIPIGQAYDVNPLEIIAWGSRAVDVYGARALGWWSMDTVTDEGLRAINHVPISEDNMRRVNGVSPDYNRVKLEPGIHGIPVRKAFGLLSTDRRVVLDLAIGPVIPIGNKMPYVIVQDGDCSYADTLSEGLGWRRNVTVYMHAGPDGTIILNVKDAPIWVEQLGILEAGS